MYSTRSFCFSFNTTESLIGEVGTVGVWTSFAAFEAIIAKIVGLYLHWGFSTLPDLLKQEVRRTDALGRLRDHGPSCNLLISKYCNCWLVPVVIP